LTNAQTCKDTSNYKIQKYHDKECINKCDQILSLNGDYCYSEEIQCENYSQVKRLANGQKICDCKYKYYNDDDHLKQCLDSSEKCPGDREKFVPKTQECVSICPSGLQKLFHGFCLDMCPQGSTEDSNNCNCEDKKWYSISESNFVCLPGDCIDTHPLLVYETKQCLKKCKYTEYPYLVNNQCHSNCAVFPGTTGGQIATFSKDYNYAFLTCRCSNNWYFDEIQRVNICPNDNEDCMQLNPSFTKIIKSTRQCVSSCTS
jgi:hypothetical protein